MPERKEISNLIQIKMVGIATTDKSPPGAGTDGGREGREVQECAWAECPGLGGWKKVACGPVTGLEIPHIPKVLFVY